MDQKIKNAIEEYQCSGCVSGCDISCFSPYGAGVGCGKHTAGTTIWGIGNVFLGIPKGFNRLGESKNTKPTIFEKFECEYDKFNVPAWKYLKDGHTFVRGIRPRKNEPFIHIFLEDCINRIDCLEITETDIDGMD